MGYMAGIAAFLVWGIGSSVLLRMVPLPGPVVTCAGCLIGGVIMLAWLGPRRWNEALALARTHPLRLLALSANFACCSLTFQWAIKTTTVANAILTHSLQALVTCLVLLPLLGERRPDRRGLAALLLGLLGLGIVFWPQLAPGHGWFGIVMGALSAVFFAGFNVLLPWFKDKADRDVVQCCNLLLSAAMVSPAVLLMDWSVPGPAGTAALLGTGLFTFVVANKLYYFAIQNAPLGRIATLAYIEPVIAIGAAAAFLGEPVTAYAVAGGMLVLTSGALVVWEPSKT